MNQMELSFSAKIENEPFARTSVASFITALNPTIDELVEIKTIDDKKYLIPLKNSDEFITKVNEIRLLLQEK